MCCHPYSTISEFGSMFSSLKHLHSDSSSHKESSEQFSESLSLYIGSCTRKFFKSFWKEYKSFLSIQKSQHRKYLRYILLDQMSRFWGEGVTRNHSQSLSRPFNNESNSIIRSFCYTDDCFRKNLRTILEGSCISPYIIDICAVKNRLSPTHFCQFVSSYLF